MRQRPSPVFLLISILAIAGLVRATEKQSVTIAQPLKAYPNLPVTAALTEDQAKAVINAVFPDASVTASHAIMVHAVKYQNGKLVAADQNWYTVDFSNTPRYETLGDLHAKERYKKPRIFGLPHLGVVYLHILEAAPADVVEAQLRGDKFAGMIRGNLQPLADAEAKLPPDKITTDITAQIEALKVLNKTDKNIEGFSKRLSDSSALPVAGNKTTALAALWADLGVETAIEQLLGKGVSMQITLVAASDGTSLVPLGGAFVKTGTDALSTLTYGISIQSKDKAPLSNLKQIIGLAIGAQSVAKLQLPIDIKGMAFAAGGVFDTTLTTSDVAVTATYTSAGKDTQIGTQTYDNEGRYWYDFSLALPIRSYNDLAYDSNANGLSVRKIQKNNVYAAFDFGLPRDTKNMKFQLVPVLMYGIPIASQPLKHHMFAASMGLNYVNFFAGAALDAKDFYHDFSRPLKGDNVFRAWRTHLVYGINFDVATIAKALTKSK